MEGLNRKPHFVLVPWLGTISHILPTSDLASLLASHGASVTIITTPVNAPIAQSRVDRGGAAVAVTAIPFPVAGAGLSEGCERMDLLRSGAEVPGFFSAVKKFGEAVAQHCRDEAAAPCRRPSCIISGMCHTWTLGLARELGVPCYVFHGFGAFALLCIEYIYARRPQEAAASADEFFSVPVLPSYECRLSSQQLPPHVIAPTSLAAATLQGVREFDTAVDGIVVNSFEELEHGSTALLAAATGKERCVAWLDAKESKTVVYVSFGTAGRLPPAQLMEIGKALVSCPWPVLWVIKGAESLPDDVKNWLRENTETDGEVTKRKCLVVCGWAPQVTILAHPAIGGFMTHCGWGSTLEGVTAGVPMATWPLFAEQFINEKLIVDLLGIGVPVGVTKATENVMTASDDARGGVAEPEVGSGRVMKALERLMDQGAEGEERRRKARDLKSATLGALDKGRSSYTNLEKLVGSLLV
ncbi:hypothetical protein PR202_ga19638 [Eleusine coracana subsp. coracana]|uniref:Glycosyltransferase n=1 Tax=Eleusine coracana subsp. coracana TaxID=191504 RepID=A0AAV5CW40_ELECO|nr:hypothetical protein PR202_ga19638 [Eleusine coracana subsp. coracana]